MEERIARAQVLLREIHHVALATVNPDGSPHNTPVFTGVDGELQFVWLWSSDPTSQHSINIGVTGQVFLTLFDSREGHGGLYVRADAGIVAEHEFAHSLATFNAIRRSLGKPLLDAAHFQGENPQHLYIAKPQTIWVNVSERNDAGYVTKDSRHEISIDRLQPDHISE